MPKWKQHYDKSFQLYHLSEKILENTVLVPRSLDRRYVMETENWRTKRICFSSSIEGCLKGIGYSDYDCIGKILNVYVPADLESLFKNDKVYKPSLKQVPDSCVTGEYWVKSKCQVQRIGQIRIDKLIDGNLKESNMYFIEDSKMFVDDFEWSWC